MTSLHYERILRDFCLWDCELLNPVVSKSVMLGFDM